MLNDQLDLTNHVVHPSVLQSSSLPAIKIALSNLLSTTSDSIKILQHNATKMTPWLEEAKNNTSKTDGTVSIKLNSGVLKLKEKKASATPPKRASPPIPADTPTISGDYSKAKAPANQIPLVNFISYTDQYFRPLTEQDMLFLKEHDDSEAFIIPPQGIHYLGLLI